jgi:drug/metabolite transporter superfamily protein YnfA
MHMHMHMHVHMHMHISHAHAHAHMHMALQVLGNVKVVLSIFISLLIFGNRVSEWSAAGCVVTLLGVAMYNSAPK